MAHPSRRRPVLSATSTLRRDPPGRGAGRLSAQAAELAETGLADWGASLPPDDEGLVDVNAGKAVRWVEGQGWVGESV